MILPRFSNFGRSILGVDWRSEKTVSDLMGSGVGGRKGFGISGIMLFFLCLDW